MDAVVGPLATQSQFSWIQLASSRCRRYRRLAFPAWKLHHASRLRAARRCMLSGCAQPLCRVRRRLGPTKTFQSQRRTVDEKRSSRLVQPRNPPSSRRSRVVWSPPSGRESSLASLFDRSSAQLLFSVDVASPCAQAHLTSVILHLQPSPSTRLSSAHVSLLASLCCAHHRPPVIIHIVRASRSGPWP
jgi:hypothetical protein